MTSINAPRLSLVITEFSWHVLIEARQKYRKRCILKKYTYANYKYIISNEFNTKRLSFVTISRGIIQTGVEYLTLFLFDTHFTSIVRKYQL